MRKKPHITRVKGKWWVIAYDCIALSDTISEAWDYYLSRKDEA